MELTKTHIKLIQNQLNNLGYFAGKEDGILGDNTKKALSRVLRLKPEWGIKRKSIGFIQLLCKNNKIEVGEIDGFWGPQTDYAYDLLTEFLKTGSLNDNWRNNNPLNINPNNWPTQNEDKLINFYGEVGSNQTRIQLPYTHKLSWDKRVKINSIMCNEKVAISLEKILNNVLNNYGITQIRNLNLDIWGGCLNVRKIRGGNDWSTHSWGIAMDYDPENNKLKWGLDKAKFAKPVYDKWWQFWEEEGWVSLGRTKNFDWMHVQAAKIV